jgi:hypothetical protein
MKICHNLNFFKGQEKGELQFSHWSVHAHFTLVSPIKCAFNYVIAQGPFVLKTLFAFGRLQSSLPKALKPLFAPHPLDFIKIGYLKASSDTFADY